MAGIPFGGSTIAILGYAVDQCIASMVQASRDRASRQRQARARGEIARLDRLPELRVATARADLLAALLSGIMYSRHPPWVPSWSVDASDSGRADAGRR